MKCASCDRLWRLPVVLACCLILSSAAHAGTPEFLPGQQVGTMEFAAINEASGIAPSRQNPNVLWVHNDSGDTARVFAMTTGGNHLGIYNIIGASAQDWEDMAIGPGPAAGVDYLYLGDIGDNGATRSSITVYRVPEPAVNANQSPVTAGLGGVESIRLQYPDGARDAETLMVDPATRDIYIISKRESLSRIYRAPYPQSTIGTTIMEYKGQLPWGWATGGDISPAGSEIIVRSSGSGSLWVREPGTDLWDALAGTAHSIPIRSEPQGEAIGFDALGLGYYTVSENVHQPIYYYQQIPEPATFMLFAIPVAAVCRKRLRRR